MVPDSDLWSPSPLASALPYYLVISLISKSLKPHVGPHRNCHVLNAVQHQWGGTSFPPTSHFTNLKAVWQSMQGLHGKGHKLNSMKHCEEMTGSFTKLEVSESLSGDNALSAICLTLWGNHLSAKSSLHC